MGFVLVILEPDDDLALFNLVALLHEVDPLTTDEPIRPPSWYRYTVPVKEAANVPLTGLAPSA